jgi:hypothetical protein
MRVYAPATLALLGEYVANGQVPAGDRFVAEDESEDAEYEALNEAATAAALLLDGPGRRVVVVADLVDPDAAFPVSEVDAVHADTEPVDPTDDALPELGWFAAQEIEDLLASR